MNINILHQNGSTESPETSLYPNTQISIAQQLKVYEDIAYDPDYVKEQEDVKKYFKVFC